MAEWSNRAPEQVNPVVEVPNRPGPQQADARSHRGHRHRLPVRDREAVSATFDVDQIKLSGPRVLPVRHQLVTGTVPGGVLR